MKIYFEYIKEYKDYYDQEERYKDILEPKKIELYLTIEPLIKEKIKSILDKEKDVKYKANKLFKYQITFTSNIGLFSKEYEEKLKNPNTEKLDIEIIHTLRIEFFKSIGIKIDKYNKKYNELIKRENIKEIIPNIKLATEITKLRKQFLEEANIEYIINSASYKNIVSKINGSETTKSFIYYLIKNNKICLVYGIDDQQKIYTINLFNN